MGSAFHEAPAGSLHLHPLTDWGGGLWPPLVLIDRGAAFGHPYLLTRLGG
jgi:hypothetical protein